MNFDIHIIPVSTGPAPTAAGWLAGDDSAAWLKELGRCEEQGKPVHLFAVAKSTGDHSCAGAFLVPKNRDRVPAFSKRVLPLCEVEKSIFLPAGSTLSAGLLDHERSFLFPHSYHLVHPSLGAVGFSEEEAIEPSNLLAFPPVNPTSWEYAIPGPDPPPPFTGITVSQPDPPDQLIDQAGADIGSRGGGLGKGSEGMGAKLGNLGKGLAGGALLGLSALGGLMAGAGGGRNSQGRRSTGQGGLSQDQSDQFLNWARKNWEGLFDARKREIDRLLKKLRENPDEGLKYALPLTGGEGARGFAPPSTRLGMRSTGFSMGGGGGPADSWDLSLDHRLALEKQYRDAAAREIKKGNIDRAAYILGNLLGDWNAAAKAFEDAGDYRKAVSIYLHKVNNTRAAAICYEKGNMPAQAADLYEKSNALEKAGDLHHEMGSEERARKLWMKAADQNHDVLLKARIWSDKLGHDAMALELLDREWPLGNRSGDILDEMCRLLQRSSQVEGAIKLGNRVLNHQQPIGGLGLNRKLEVLHRAATRWNDPRLVEWIHGEMWRRIAEAVSNESKLTPKLLKLIPLIEPQDNLLKRDVLRFSLPRKQLKSVVPRKPKGSLRPAEICEIQVQGAWCSLRPMGDGASFTGRGSGIVVFGRWEKGNACRATEFRIPEDPKDGGPVEHTVVGSGKEHQRILHFKSSRRAYFQTSGVTRGEKHEGLSNISQVLAIGPQVSTGDFVLLRYTETNSLMVASYHKKGDLLNSIPIDIAPPNVMDLTWQIAASEQLTGIAADNFFGCRNQQGFFTTLALHGLPRSLDISPGNGESFLIVVDSEVIHVEYLDQGRLETVNLYISEMGSCPPVASFLHDGLIAIAWSGGGTIYSPENFLKPIASFSFPQNAGDPVGICSRGVNEFVVLSQTGNLIRFDFEEGVRESRDQLTSLPDLPDVG